nr:uncharacterized protein LOC112750603 isoform X2 [Arachis hypogaea]
MAPQSSSQSSRSRSKTRGRRRTCFCGERPVLRTSSIAENLGRRFWGCINYQNRSEKNVIILLGQMLKGKTHKFRD